MGIEKRVQGEAPEPRIEEGRINSGVKDRVYPEIEERVETQIEGSIKGNSPEPRIEEDRIKSRIR